MDAGTLAGYGVMLGICVGLFIFFRITRRHAPPQPDMKVDEAEATPGRGTVVSFYEHTGGDLRTQNARGDRRTIFIRIEVPDGEDYTTWAVWQIKYGHRERLQEQMELAVKIHHERPDVLFPAEDWIEMTSWGFLYRILRRPDALPKL